MTLRGKIYVDMGLRLFTKRTLSLENKGTKHSKCLLFREHKAKISLGADDKDRDLATKFSSEKVPHRNKYCLDFPCFDDDIASGSSYTTQSSSCLVSNLCRLVFLSLIGRRWLHHSNTVSTLQTSLFF